MAYNTAVSSLMILANSYDEADTITKKDYTLLLTLLNPIAPHITEQLNEEIGNSPIVNSKWPVYDEAKTIDNQIEIGIQVNGKLRGTITVKKDEKKEVLEKLALSNDNVSKHIENKEIVKIITVVNRIVNIVVK